MTVIVEKLQTSYVHIYFADLQIKSLVDILFVTRTTHISIKITAHITQVTARVHMKPLSKI